MTAPKRSNRLSPPLMWAFRSAHDHRDAKSKAEQLDGDGNRVLPGRKSASQTSITEPVLRREVWRDLESLLNTVALESTVEDVLTLEHVRKSILNFGLPDMAHRTIDELGRNDHGIEREIETALRNFEPRLLQGTIRVQRDTSIDAKNLRLRFLICADLSCRPVDIPVEFTADVELDSGKVIVNRL